MAKQLQINQSESLCRN